jgi:hypothetical protein
VRHRAADVVGAADRKHGIGVGGKADNAEKQKEYEQLFRRQLTEGAVRNAESLFLAAGVSGECAVRPPSITVSGP